VVEVPDRTSVVTVATSRVVVGDDVGRGENLHHLRVIGLPKAHELPLFLHDSFADQQQQGID
jgi:hypothetical protein